MIWVAGSLVSSSYFILILQILGSFEGLQRSRKQRCFMRLLQKSLSRCSRYKEQENTLFAACLQPSHDPQSMGIQNKMAVGVAPDPFIPYPNTKRKKVVWP